MFLSIVYKEYLKTYKIIFFFMSIIIFILFNTFLDAKNSFEYQNATSAVLNVLYMERFYFNYFNYIFPLFAIILGVFQFYPEVFNARIRLYLHLPLNKTILVTIFIFLGLIFISVIFLLILNIYSFILNTYYPYEIYEAIKSKLISIYLASLLCYLTTMIVFLEPNNLKRLLYISTTFFTLLIYEDTYMSKYFVSILLDKVIIGIIIIYIINAYEVLSSYTKGYIK